MSIGQRQPTVRLASLKPGTHLCAFHRDGGQLTRIASTFISQGLAAGDQMLYVTTDERAESMLGALPADLASGDALGSGQLMVRSFVEAYGEQRPDDLDVVADGFRAAAQQARKDGFPGLRVAAEMDGLPGLLGSTEAVLDWERMCTGLQAEIGVSSVCLYDATTLDPESMDLLAHEHAGLAPELDESPLARFLAVDEPWGLRVSGEIDLFNRDLFRRTLLSRAAVSPRVHLDLGGLTFVDGAGVSVLRSVAEALPEHGLLSLARVPAVVRRIVDIAGIRHERLGFE